MDFWKILECVYCSQLKAHVAVFFYLLVRGKKGKAGWDSSLGLCLGLWQKPSLLALLCLLGQDDRRNSHLLPGLHWHFLEWLWTSESMAWHLVTYLLSYPVVDYAVSVLSCIYLLFITRKIFCMCFKKINLKGNQNTCQRKTRIGLQGFLTC